jgi:MoaA/NifB/PqqE/SkfB family radical SAM enzyme
VSQREIEIQLGHLCNNRCVFCVSGQETARGNAGVADMAPVIAELGRARERGHLKVTILGGEPTLQPGFLDVVRHAARLGFEEIVVFTNGARTARAAFVDEVRAAGEGRVTWRLSLQGATREAHERTTRKDGSWDRLLRTLAILHARGERVTVNMCVVAQNHASVAAFPALLVPFGVRQLHLDMVRPLDTGDRTEDELSAMMVPYGDLVPALTAMVRGFPEGFDVNIGNLPYCVAPHLARFIHHDGEPTLTVAVDGQGAHSAPWDKYQVKRRDKIKPATCATCALEPQCSGVFDTYRRLHGTSELRPIAPDELRAILPDATVRPRALQKAAPSVALPRIHGPAPSPPLARSIALRLARLRQRAPFGALVWRDLIVQEGGSRVEAVFEGPAGERATVWLAETAGRPAGGYRVDANGSTPPGGSLGGSQPARASLGPSAALVEGLRAIMDALRARPGPVVP